MPTSVIGSPGIDISATCFRPLACAGLAKTMAARAATITDVERGFIGSLPRSFFGKPQRQIITIRLMCASLQEAVSDLCKPRRCTIPCSEATLSLQVRCCVRWRFGANDIRHHRSCREMADYADHIGETLIAERRFGSLEHVVSKRPCRQQSTRHGVHHLVGAVPEFRLFPRVDGL